MHTAYEYMITLIRKHDLQELIDLASFLEEAYGKVHIVGVGENAALCSANIYSISFMKDKTKPVDESNKVKQYFKEFPESMHIKAAYLTVCRIDYVDTSTYRRVPDKLISNAKTWAKQYPEEIEFPEGYFDLLLDRLEYAQAHDQRNEQRRLFREMKSVAERTDYSEYGEESDMLATIKMIQQVYGYE